MCVCRQPPPSRENALTCIRRRTSLLKWTRRRWYSCCDTPGETCQTGSACSHVCSEEHERTVDQLLFTTHECAWISVRYNMFISDYFLKYVSSYLIESSSDIFTIILIVFPIEKLNKTSNHLLIEMKGDILPFILMLDLKKIRPSLSRAPFTSCHQVAIILVCVL